MIEDYRAALALPLVLAAAAAAARYVPWRVKEHVR